MTEEKQPLAATVPRINRLPDYWEDYSNYTRYESSVWDLKLVFGKLDQSTNPHTVNQFGAVSLPWPQVKILIYLLQVNLLFHERANGKVNVPESVMPASFASYAPQIAKEPGGEELLKQLEQLRAKLF